MANTSTPLLCLDSVLFPGDSTCPRSPPSPAFGGDVASDVLSTVFPLGSVPSSAASGSSRPSSSHARSCFSSVSSPSGACASSSDIVATTRAQSKRTMRRSRSKRTKRTSSETVEPAPGRHGPGKSTPLSSPAGEGQGRGSEKGVRQAAGEVRVCRSGQKGRLKGKRWVCWEEMDELEQACPMAREATPKRTRRRPWKWRRTCVARSTSAGGTWIERKCTWKREDGTNPPAGDAVLCCHERIWRSQRRTGNVSATSKGGLPVR